MKSRIKINRSIADCVRTHIVHENNFFVLAMLNRMINLRSKSTDSLICWYPKLDWLFFFFKICRKENADLTCTLRVFAWKEPNMVMVGSYTQALSAARHETKGGALIFSTISSHHTENYQFQKINLDRLMIA